MSEKYTIDFDGSSTIIQDKEGEIFSVLVDKDGCLIEYSKAELVCRLLNEEEKRKSLPKIDREIKNYMLTILNTKMEWFAQPLNICDLQEDLKAFAKENIKKYSDFIKVIESLESQ